MGKAHDVKKKLKETAQKVKGGVKQDVGDNLEKGVENVTNEVKKGSGDIKQKWDEFSDDNT